MAWDDYVDEFTTALSIIAPILGILAPPLGLVAGGLAVAGQAYQSREARQEAQEQRRDERAEFARRERELRDRTAQDDAIRARDDARKRQRQQAAGAFGRSDTVLTPLGAMPAPDLAYKTALGQ